MNIQRKLLSAVLAAALITPIGTAHAGWLGNVLGTAVQAVAIDVQIRDLDENGQQEVLEQSKERTGYYENQAYQDRAQRILNRLVETGVPERDYVIYVNPSEDINAFMTFAGVMSVNKGVLDELDDHQLAFVLAHEITHGENRDIVNGVRKQIGLSLVGGAIGSGMIIDLGLNFVQNEVFTMKQEKKADASGFEILAASDFDLGAAPAAMQSLLDISGNHYRTGISRVVAPNNHPHGNDRIDAMMKKITEYSDDIVTVEEDTVYLNDLPAITTIESSPLFTSKIRAYFVAGKLARLIHEGALTPATVSGGTLRIGDTPIYGLANSESHSEKLATMNRAINAVLGIKDDTTVTITPVEEPQAVVTFTPVTDDDAAIETEPNKDTHQSIKDLLKKKKARR